MHAPHAEAMKLYAQADLVIDQLLAGWYGGFAVETMAMGKPVVCYIRAEDLQFVPPAMVAELPLIPARPTRWRTTWRRRSHGGRNGRPGAAADGSSPSAGTIRGGSPKR